MSSPSTIVAEASTGKVVVRDLLNYIRCYDHAISEESCAKMVETFERCREHQNENGANARPGLELSRWTEMDLTKLSDPTFQQFFVDNVRHYKERYEVDCGLPRPLPEPSRLAPLRMKRYRPGGTKLSSRISTRCVKSATATWFFYGISTTSPLVVRRDSWIWVTMLRRFAGAC